MNHERHGTAIYVEILDMATGCLEAYYRIEEACTAHLLQLRVIFNDQRELGRGA